MSHEHEIPASDPENPLSRNTIDTKTDPPPQAADPAPTPVKQTLETTPAAPGDSVILEKTADTTPAEGRKHSNDPVPSQKNGEAGKTGEKGKPEPDVKTGEENRSYPKNRPWIIKDEQPEKGPSLRSLQEKLKWKDDRQKTECNAMAARLRDCFLKSRYHSIRGDSCVTAQYASACRKLADECREGCPPGFLPAHGYSDRIIRNWGWLEKLGKEGCLK